MEARDMNTLTDSLQAKTVINTDCINSRLEYMRSMQPEPKIRNILFSKSQC